MIRGRPDECGTQLALLFKLVAFSVRVSGIVALRGTQVSGRGRMEAELNELAQRAKSLRNRMEALQKDLGDLTLPLRKVQDDLEEIESFLDELAAMATG